MPKNIKNREVRNGISDIWWNAFMVKDAKFSPKSDIPFCPTTAKNLPADIITYREAKAIYRFELQKNKNKNFLHYSYVAFYEDDQFDNTKGIWFRSDYAYRILCHFAGIITPDFSTNQDFPVPLKTWNTYRMRAFGYWYGSLNGNCVINNVRWGTEETYEYCFDGIPQNSIVSIGTVGGSPRKRIDRYRFEKGLDKMMQILHPHTILVYGSAKYPCFDKLVSEGIKIVEYPSRTARAYERSKRGE